MPVFNVELFAPNGNCVSAPIVAADADGAIAEMEARHNIAPNDPQFTIVAKERVDDGGRLERMLVDAEIRRQDADFYRAPAPRRRVRR